MEKARKHDLKNSRRPTLNLGKDGPQTEKMGSKKSDEETSTHRQAARRSLSENKLTIICWLCSEMLEKNMWIKKGKLPLTVCRGSKLNPPKAYSTPLENKTIVEMVALALSSKLQVKIKYKNIYIDETSYILIWRKKRHLKASTH